MSLRWDGNCAGLARKGAARVPDCVSPGAPRLREKHWQRSGSSCLRVGGDGAGGVLRAGICRRARELALLDCCLSGARISVSHGHANLGRKPRDAVGMQEAVVRVALGDEQSPFSARVLPVERVLPGVGATGTQDRVRGSGALARRARSRHTNTTSGTASARWP